MSPQKPTVSTRDLDGLPVSEDELDAALAYARKPKPEGKYERELDRDLLRLVVNTAIERRGPGEILPRLVAEIAREVLPYGQKKDALKYEAYKGAAMKVFSDRSAWKRKGVARKKRLKREAQAPPEKGKPLEDKRPKYRGQLKLF